MKKNHALADKAAGHIANFILGIQQQFANRLEKISVSWKVKQQWIFLYLVCLVFGGLSVIAIVHPFNKRGVNMLSKPAAIKKPFLIPEDKQQFSRITDAEIRQVNSFKQSLDSTAKKKLMASRPGLMDSLEMVEQLYYTQKK